MNNLRMFTRRQFVQHAERAGGPDAAYHSMLALGLLAESHYKPIQLQGYGNGKRVVILGAGLAGMCAAFELNKLGYECVIVEARNRAGGRCWTVRRGTDETEVTGARQVCSFDEGLYYNPGPSRIPYHHRGVLSYCKQFGIELDAVVNFNNAAYYFNQNVDALANSAVPQREAVADLRGYSAELLSKALSQHALDERLTADDRERLMAYLKVYGDLSDVNGRMLYSGTPRRGYRVWPGAGTAAGQVAAPHELSALLASGFWKYFHTQWAYNEQMTMLAPVGGMDRIAAEFEKRVHHQIHYGIEVRAIRRSPAGVHIATFETRTRRMGEVRGDYCICTLPLPVLATIPGDYWPGLQNAIRNVAYGTGMRMGLQFSRRFWEDDEGIFGGITWTSQIIQQILYPESNFHSQKGVLLAAYPFGTKAYHISAMTPPRRIEAALAAGEKIHPRYREFFENGFSVAWHLVRYNLGCYTAYSDKARESFYPILNKTDGRLFLAGEHMSYLIGWMEGSILSGLDVVEKVHGAAQSGMGGGTNG